uniref:Elongator complex protein 5 n=1 Tax=Zeugodacus cucurbitae TaxID=28588 RepID=A0A0A1WIX2_ZEUCU
MLSNLIITSQRFVVIIDETAQEKIAHNILCQLLREQGQDEKSTIKTLPFSTDLKNWPTFINFYKKCANDESKCNAILPPLADLLCYQSVEKIIHFVHRLQQCEQVQRVFLWVTPANLVHARADYLVAAFEYLADLVLHLETSNTLSIVTRKTGGGVSNKKYTYTKNKTEFLVEAIRTTPKTSPAAKTSPTTAATTTNTVGTTFKIELNEDEMVARNTLKLPYEKTSETNESSIIYTPDDDDDFDEEEEDPDDDLCI